MCVRFSILAGSERLELPLHLVEFLVSALLQIDELVASRVDAAEDLIELEVQGAGVAVLGVLN